MKKDPDQTRADMEVGSSSSVCRLSDSPRYETTGCSFLSQSAGLMSWDRHTDEQMTSTRPKGERTHAPHPDVAIATTTSSLLEGNQKSPVGTQETSVSGGIATLIKGHVTLPTSLPVHQSELVLLVGPSAVHSGCPAPR